MKDKNKVIVSVYLEKEVVDSLDKERDGIPRSVYINEILRVNLKGGKYGLEKKEKRRSSRN